MHSIVNRQAEAKSLRRERGRILSPLHRTPFAANARVNRRAPYRASVLNALLERVIAQKSSIGHRSMLCAEADPEREGDEQKTAENISDGGWEDAPAER